MHIKAGETRSEHCKVYTYPTVKKAIDKYRIRKGLTFSEAAQELLIVALDAEGIS
jgi:hypothetical protein